MKANKKKGIVRLRRDITVKSVAERRAARQEKLQMLQFDEADEATLEFFNKYRPAQSAAVTRTLAIIKDSNA